MIIARVFYLCSDSACNLYYAKPKLTYTVTTPPAIQAHCERPLAREWRCALDEYGHSKLASARFGRFLCALAVLGCAVLCCFVCFFRFL